MALSVAVVLFDIFSVSAVFGVVFAALLVFDYYTFASRRWSSGGMGVGARGRRCDVRRSFLLFSLRAGL